MPEEYAAPDLTSDVYEIYQTRFVGFASFTLLFYDMIITFDDEVEYIWKRSKGLLAYLFLINRYVMPLAFIVNLTAYILQSWSIDTCGRYVRYEGAMTVIGIEIVALMMLIRIYALYRKDIRPIILLAFILVAETGVNIWLLTHGVAVQHPSGEHSCSMIFHGVNPGAASAWVWIPLTYDTVVLLLVIYHALPAVWHKQAGHVMRTIFHDGLLYYGAIFSVTLPPIIMSPIASPGIRNVVAQFQLLVTVAMMSRLTLHLKAQGDMSTPVRSREDDPACDVTFSRDRSFSDATTRTRSHSFTRSDYLTGGADIGVNYIRPAPLRRLSPISSECSFKSGKWAPDTNGDSPVSTSGTVIEITRWGDTQLNRVDMDITQIQAPIKIDEETQ